MEQFALKFGPRQTYTFLTASECFLSPSWFKRTYELKQCFNILCTAENCWSQVMCTYGFIVTFFFLLGVPEVFSNNVFLRWRLNKSAVCVCVSLCVSVCLRERPLLEHSPR